MIPKSRDNRITIIMAHHANHMNAIHLPMLTQIRSILGSPKMIPFTTIFKSVKYPFEKSRVSEGFSEKKCSCVSVPMAREFFTSRKT